MRYFLVDWFHGESDEGMSTVVPAEEQDDNLFVEWITETVDKDVSDIMISGWREIKVTDRRKEPVGASGDHDVHDITFTVVQEVDVKIWETSNNKGFGKPDLKHKHLSPESIIQMYFGTLRYEEAKKENTDES